MKHPTFKEFSQTLDEWRKYINKPKMWIVKKWAVYLCFLFCMAIICDVIRESEAQEEFNAKYKTVIKKNCIGLTSYEYHER